MIKLYRDKFTLQQYSNIKTIGWARMGTSQIVTISPIMDKVMCKVSRIHLSFIPPLLPSLLPLLPPLLPPHTALLSSNTITLAIFGWHQQIIKCFQLSHILFHEQLLLPVCIKNWNQQIKSLVGQRRPCHPLPRNPTGSAIDPKTI